MPPVTTRLSPDPPPVSPPDPPGEAGGMLRLLSSRRFGPFFHTQFLGAFNDNIFKNALIIFISFRPATEGGMRPEMLVNLAAALFILPFFLFSAPAGQICDFQEKARLIRRVKLAETAIMTGALFAFWFQSVPLLLVLLFAMGAQSAFFGPVKYSLIPQHLRTEEVVSGNALVSLGTFMAILLGALTGGILIQYSPILVGLAVWCFAVAGWLASQGIPPAPPEQVREEAPPVSPAHFFRLISSTLGHSRTVYSVFLSVMAISWFWFLGSVYITHLAVYSRDVLQGNKAVVTLLLTMFSLGIGLGSILCGKASGKRVEPGLVPIGAIGLSLFGLDLVFADTAPPGSSLMGLAAFLSTEGSFRVLADILLIGISGGCYIVPLNAFIQTRTEAGVRARVIAANNIFNALFMVMAALFSMLVLGPLGMTVSGLFLLLVPLNLIVALYVFSRVPEFTIRFLIFLLTRLLYKVRGRGISHLPENGPAVLVCNHVSYVDGLIIAGICRRPVRFVIHRDIFRIPVLHFIFRAGKGIPITSRKKDPECYDAAFESISTALREGEIVCIFPEGRLTPDGELGVFRRGVETILERDPVPVIPMALSGLWGSFFSHRAGRAMTVRKHRFRHPVILTAGQRIAPEKATADGLREMVRELMAQETSTERGTS